MGFDFISLEKEHSYVDCFHLVFWGYSGRPFRRPAFLKIMKKRRLLLYFLVLLVLFSGLVYYSGIPRKQDYLYQHPVQLSTLDQKINQTYQLETIALPDDYEGKVVATLLSKSASNLTDSAVIYLHGWADYFFHDHLASWFNEQGYDFYALELRKYGRSLLAHQKPNYCRDLQEYFPEIDSVIQRVTQRDGHQHVLVFGHSTGGLTASLYAAQGQRRQEIDGLILNSPFLGFKADGLMGNVLRFYGFLGRFNYNGVLPREGSPLYTQTIHRSEKGEWDFNFAWRPRTGFPFYQSWANAILKGHQQVNDGLDIKCPVLLLTSQKSYTGGKLGLEARSADVVLDAPTIRSKATKLGKQVSSQVIPGGLHDIFLSPKPIRDKAFEAIEKWEIKMKDER